MFSGVSMRPQLLSLMRIAIALTFSQHAVVKLLGCTSVGCIPQPFTPLWLSGILEIMFGSMLLFGLASRSVALLLAGEAAIAYFTMHTQQGFFPFLDDGALAIVYCIAFLYLSVAGPGAWSIDAITGSKPARAA